MRDESSDYCEDPESDGDRAALSDEGYRTGESQVRLSLFYDRDVNIGYVESQGIRKCRHRRYNHDRVSVLLFFVDLSKWLPLRDDHYYQIQSERSRIHSEKEALEKVYQTLLEEHRTLQTNFDDLMSEKEEALAQARQAQRDADNRRPDTRGDTILKAEIDRLRAEM